MEEIISDIHQSTHFGQNAVLQWIQKIIMDPNIREPFKRWSKTVTFVPQNNVRTELPPVLKGM